ncbi:MAG: hypothetical protein PVG30_00485 [Gammaproteobacteria bacterium]|jgi:hypothetical protein
MFLLGILALIQICFLPGFILLVYLRDAGGVIKTGLVSFALALVINYFVVLIAVLFHIYSPVLLYLLFFIEVIACVCLWKYGYFNNLSKSSEFLTGSIRDLQFVFLLVILYYGFYYVVNPFSPIFAFSDSVFRWNKWALIWSHGKIPVGSWLYPQLLPVNWSLSYVFTAGKIELFAKWMVGLFPLAILFILFDLRVRLKNFAYTISVFCAMLLFYLILGRASFGGYADTACAFMVTISLYLLFISVNENAATVIRKRLFLGAIVVAGAALTKQAGLYVALLYTFYAYAMVLRDNKLFFTHAKIKIISVMVALIIILVAPWYGYKLLVFARHLHTTHIFNMLAINSYYKFTILQRLHFAVQLIVAALKNIFVCAFLLFVMIYGAVNSRLARSLVCWFIIPYFLVWAIGFAYDLRNLAWLIPLVSIVLGFGLHNILLRLYKLFINYTYKFYIGLVAALLVVLCGYNFVFSQQVLYNRQVVYKVRLGALSPIVRGIYSYFASNKIKPYKIMTNYVPLNFLPGFSGHTATVNFVNADTVRKLIETQQPQYFLIDKFLVADHLMQKKGIAEKFGQPLEVADGLPSTQLIGFKEEQEQHVLEFLQKNIFSTPYLKKHRRVIIHDDPSVLFFEVT